MRIFDATKGLLLLFTAATLFNCSCGPKDPQPSSDATLSVNPTRVEANYEGQTVTVEVTSSGDWGVFSSDKDWCNVSPSGGIKGTSTVNVTLGTNRSGAERSATVTFKYGGKSLELPVVQGFSQEDIPPAPGEIVVPEGYKLVWNDEFDVDGMPDTNEWWYETGTNNGWGNNEIQDYKPGQYNGEKLAYISDGTLKIETKRVGGTLCSIRMNTKKGWQYGWFEASIKVSDVPGSWPAFWMMPKNFNKWPDDGEIDIMEYAISTQGKNYSSSSIHCGAFNWPKGTQKTHKQYVSDAASGFHVYALEWTAEEMKFYIDGKQHLVFKNDGAGYSHWPFDQPFYLKLNQAWGGNMGGTTDESKLPAVYEIDYVRVFTKK